MFNGGEVCLAIMLNFAGQIGVFAWQVNCHLTKCLYPWIIYKHIWLLKVAFCRYNKLINCWWIGWWISVSGNWKRQKKENGVFLWTSHDNTQWCIWRRVVPSTAEGGKIWKVPVPSFDFWNVPLADSLRMNKMFVEGKKNYHTGKAKKTA